MEDLDALIKRVIESEKTIDVWKDDFKSVERTEASKLNWLLYGTQFNHNKGCECVHDLFIVLRTEKNITKLKMMSEKQFILKKGRLIMSHLHPHVSEHSSDEEMIILLKRNPKYIEAFKSTPKNWKKIVAEYEPTDETKAADSTSGAGTGSPEGGGSPDDTTEIDTAGRIAFLVGMGYAADDEATAYIKEGCDPVTVETIDTVEDFDFFKPFTKKLIQVQLTSRKIAFETDANKGVLIGLVTATVEV